MTAGASTFDGTGAAPASAGGISAPFGGADTGLSGDALALAVTDDLPMDTIGARHLAARLRARVPVGATIVLEHGSTEFGLEAGDRGVVEKITPEGVVVEWERGFTLQIDPDLMPYRALEAA